MLNCSIPCNQSGDNSAGNPKKPYMTSKLDRHFISTHTIAFAALLMLALPALPSLNAQAPATTQVSGSALTAELMAKMLQLIERRGTDHEMGARLASFLELSAGGQVWLYRSVTAPGTQDKMQHGFFVSRGSDQDIVIGRRSDRDAHLFRAHRDGKVVLALSVDIKTNEILMRPPFDAQAEFESEVKLWAGGIDRLLAKEK